MAIKQIQSETAKMELIHHNKTKMKIQILSREIKECGQVEGSRDQLWLIGEQTYTIH